jgi:hypothetical protein
MFKTICLELKPWIKIQKFVFTAFLFSIWFLAQILFQPSSRPTLFLFSIASPARQLRVAHLLSTQLNPLHHPSSASQKPCIDPGHFSASAAHEGPPGCHLLLSAKPPPPLHLAVAPHCAPQDHLTHHPTMEINQPTHCPIASPSLKPSPTASRPPPSNGRSPLKYTHHPLWTAHSDPRPPPPCKRHRWDGHRAPPPFYTLFLPLRVSITSPMKPKPLPPFKPIAGLTPSPHRPPVPTVRTPWAPSSFSPTTSELPPTGVAPSEHSGEPLTYSRPWSTVDHRHIESMGPCV